jgi:hypothetical protein
VFSNESEPAASVYPTGGWRLPLPRFARVVVTERPDPRGDSGQRVDVRIRVPLLGEVFRYAGTFTYRVEAGNGGNGGSHP